MSDFICHVREGLDEETRQDWRNACDGPPKYIHNQKRYCVLHFPSEEKEEDFKKVLKSKLAEMDHNFSGTVFTEGTSDFTGFKFDNANFAGATFVRRAIFTGAQFSGERTDFTGAQFSGWGTFFS